MLPALAAVAALLMSGCGGSGEPTGAGSDGTSPLPEVSIEDVPEEHFTDPVAVVNGVQVYRATYEQFLTFLRDRIDTGGAGNLERYIHAHDDALERTIDMELLYQEAARRGYAPGHDALKLEYARRVSGFESEEAYLASAKSQYFSKSEILDGIRRELGVKEFVDEEILGKLDATEEELREFYMTHQEPFVTERSARVGSIFIGAPQGAPKPERSAALTRISKALERLQKGESFERVATEVSEDEVAFRGGMLGFVKPGFLPRQLDQVAFGLNPGEISTIIETDDGYHLLKVYQKQGGELKPFDEVEEQVREQVLTRKKDERIRSLVASLREKAEIERQLI
jgi:parvulin-like peptidyl-prolyl isomerase